MFVQSTNIFCCCDSSEEIFVMEGQPYEEAIIPVLDLITTVATTKTWLCYSGEWACVMSLNMTSRKNLLELAVATLNLGRNLDSVKVFRIERVDELYELPVSLSLLTQIEKVTIFKCKNLKKEETIARLKSFFPKLKDEDIQFVEY